MEGNVENSFLEKETWKNLQEEPAAPASL